MRTKSAITNVVGSHFGPLAIIVAAGLLIVGLVLPDSVSGQSGSVEVTIGGSVHNSPRDGSTFRRGEVIQAQIHYHHASRLVFDTSGGPPTLDIEVGSARRQARYDEASSTIDLPIFEYSVKPGDLDSDGVILVPAGGLVIPPGSTVTTINGQSATINWPVSSGSPFYIDGGPAEPSTPVSSPTPTRKVYPTTLPTGTATHTPAPTRTSTPRPTPTPTSVVSTDSPQSVKDVKFIFISGITHKTNGYGEDYFGRIFGKPLTNAVFEYQGQRFSFDGVTWRDGEIEIQLSKCLPPSRFKELVVIHRRNSGSLIAKSTDVEFSFTKLSSVRNNERLCRDWPKAHQNLFFDSSRNLFPEGDTVEIVLRLVNTAKSTATVTATPLPTQTPTPTPVPTRTPPPTATSSPTPEAIIEVVTNSFRSGKEGSTSGFERDDYGSQLKRRSFRFQGRRYFFEVIRWHEGRGEIKFKLEGCLKPTFMVEFRVNSAGLRFSNPVRVRFSDHYCEANPDADQVFYYDYDSASNPFPKNEIVHFSIRLRNEPPPTPDCPTYQPVPRSGETFIAVICSHRAPDDDHYGFDGRIPFGTISNSTIEVDGTEYTILYIYFDHSEQEVEVGLDGCLPPPSVNDFTVGGTSLGEPSSYRYSDKECHHHRGYNQRFDFNIEHNVMPVGQVRIKLSIGSPKRPSGWATISEVYCELVWSRELPDVQVSCGTPPSGYAGALTFDEPETALELVNLSLDALEQAKKSDDPDPVQVLQAIRTLDYGYRKYRVSHGFGEDFDKIIRSATRDLRELGIDPTPDAIRKILIGATCGQACLDMGHFQGDIAYLIGWITVGVSPGISILADSRDFIASGAKCTNVALNDGDLNCDVGELVVNGLAALPLELIPFFGTTAAVSIDATQAAKHVMRVARQSKKLAYLMIAKAWRKSSDDGINVTNSLLSDYWDKPGFAISSTATNSSIIELAENSGHRLGALRVIKVLLSGRHNAEDVIACNLRIFDSAGTQVGEFDIVKGKANQITHYVEVHGVNLNQSIEESTKELGEQLTRAKSMGKPIVFELFASQNRNPTAAEKRKIENRIRQLNRSGNPVVVSVHWN